MIDQYYNIIMNKILLEATIRTIISNIKFQRKKLKKDQDL
jgi:hypothetical protein